MLQLKKDKDTDYVPSWKSEEVYTSKLKTLSTAFLHSINLSWYRMGIKFDKDSLAVKQSNYQTKIVNAYTVYDLDACQKFLLTISNKKNPCLVQLFQ